MAKSKQTMTAGKVHSRTDRAANSNREAQARFRARAKARALQTQEQLESATAQLQQLRTENAHLASRSAVLEKCLELRNEHIQMLHEQHQIFEPPLPDMSESLDDLLGPGLLDMMDDLLGPHAFEPMGESMGHGAFDRNGHGSILLQAPSKLLPLLDSCMTHEHQPMHGRTAPLPRIQGQVDVRALSYDEFAMAWKTYVRMFATLLMDTTPGAESPQLLHHLCELRREARQLCMRTAVLNPVNILRLMSANMEGGVGVNAAEESDSKRFRAIVHALRVTPEQRHEIQELRREHLATVLSRQKERQEIYQRVQSAEEAGLAATPVLGATSLAMNSALQDLKQNLRKRHLDHLLFLSTMLSRVFTPLQFARLVVQSYPLYPDVATITKYIVEEPQDVQLPPGATRLAAAAMQPHWVTV